MSNIQLLLSIVEQNLHDIRNELREIGVKIYRILTPKNIDLEEFISDIEKFDDFRIELKDQKYYRLRYAKGLKNRSIYIGKDEDKKKQVEELLWRADELKAKIRKLEEIQTRIDNFVTCIREQIKMIITD